MSNILLPATCEAGQVMIDGKPVEAFNMGQGTASSEGRAHLQGTEIVYWPKAISDLENLIELLSTISTKLSTIAMGLDAVTVPPGTQVASIIDLNLSINELTLMKDQLK